ncbi:MAG: relaxase/mobilization nuclease domain-containing protein [Alphaproteobacteria bacterium]|nr:relaxase/mobilization nuclease domain-containing protein [Alphaproteobacteria bacterium]
MIPFGSQRAEGQDLATHLLNAQDNERLEVVQVRGAVARDLHGAFAEWEAQAHNLTRCTNYLYSLSINPDQRQGRLSKEQYLDFIERAEERLGLSGQPRAIVLHVKKDGHGVPREHCHVIWSRIDVERGKARHVAIDFEKLMAVTREFARDHGLRLPDGYYKDQKQDRRRGRQMSLYEKKQEDYGGVTMAQHKAQVTEAWNRRDTPRAFVRSLEELGYILATGERPYVLVDRYGNMNSLPKLIDDKTVRTKDVRAFLEKKYPKDSLPTVEEARALAAAHRAAMELFGKNEERAARDSAAKQRREELQRRQQPRRQVVEQDAKGLDERQRQSRQEFSLMQKRERMAFRQSYLQESRGIKLDRAARRPQGLAAFIGRVTGVELITKKLYEYRDATRYKLFLAQKKELAERQQRDAVALERRQQLETLSMERRLHALEQVEKRELRSLETTLLKERRTEDRERTGPQPETEPAQTHVDEFNRAAKKPIDLTAEFERASGSATGDSGSTGGAVQDPAPEAEITIQQRRRTRERSQETDRSEKPKRTKQDRTDENPSGDDSPPRRHRRDRDFDRGR